MSKSTNPEELVHEYVSGWLSGSSLNGSVEAHSMENTRGDWNVVRVWIRTEVNEDLRKYGFEVSSNPTTEGDNVDLMSVHHHLQELKSKVLDNVTAVPETGDSDD